MAMVASSLLMTVVTAMKAVIAVTVSRCRDECGYGAIVGGNDHVDGDSGGDCGDGSRFVSEDRVNVDGGGDSADCDTSAVMTAVTVASFVRMTVVMMMVLVTAVTVPRQ